MPDTIPPIGPATDDPADEVGVADGRPALTAILTPPASGGVRRSRTRRGEITPFAFRLGSCR